MASSPFRAERSKLEPFFERMTKKPGPSDWLASHNEPGQTFEQFLDANPQMPTPARNKIYVLPLGSFERKQEKVMEFVWEYLKIFYGLPVTVLPRKKLLVQSPNIRLNPSTGVRQVKTTYVLEEVLEPMVPSDAAALIALTAEDLYPPGSVNYVFGQANTPKRLGVWSLARLDDRADDLTFLRRALKIAVHETGHMFGLRHCTKYECVMSGTNHLAETDSRPIDACPECSAKICWLTDAKMADRFERLATFCRSHKLAAEANEFVCKAAALRTLP